MYPPCRDTREVGFGARSKSQPAYVVRLLEAVWAGPISPPLLESALCVFEYEDGSFNVLGMRIRTIDIGEVIASKRAWALLYHPVEVYGELDAVTLPGASTVTSEGLPNNIPSPTVYD